MQRMFRFGLALAFLYVAGCASGSAGSSADDMGARADDMAVVVVHDLAMADLSAGIPFDMAGAIVDLARASDMTLVCNVDAGQRLCEGDDAGTVAVCVDTTRCCSASECPSLTNGHALCTNHTCSSACDNGFKSCRDQCIPKSMCCNDNDCTTPPDACHLGAGNGATCQANGTCNYPAVTCNVQGQTCSNGTCACPSGQHVCPLSNSCIPDGTCCTSSDCSAILGEVCPSPGSACACTSGSKPCTTGAFSQCIPNSACCVANDCAAIAGQGCPGPGQTCTCPANQKVCPASNSCIPNGNCCSDADCAGIAGGICSAGACTCPANQHVCDSAKICIKNGTCCADTDCPLAGQHCSGIGGSCSCPAGQHTCATSNSCISDSACCSAAECPVSGEVCNGGPPGSCACPGGKRICSTTNTCIPTTTCCSASDCAPPPAHTSTTTCNGNSGNGGSCGIGVCQNGWYDVNKVYSDGCECADTIYGLSCAAATSVPALNAGDVRNLTSVLPATGTEEIWFAITFSTPVGPSYKPHIAFTAGGGEYLFDVYTDCSRHLPQGCFTGGDVSSPVNLTSYTIDVTGGDQGSTTGGDCSNRSNTGNCTPPYSPPPAISGSGVVFVRVHRSNTNVVSCNNFTLQVTD